MSERVSSHDDYLSLPLSRSSSALQRQASASSSRSGSTSGKKNASSVVPSTTTSSGSASKAGSFMSTPRLLSRRNSAREGSRPPSYLMRKLSGKGKAKEIDTQLEEAVGSGTELDEPNVIETPSLHIDRDPSTGRKMINQYLVLQEIGYGTHGRVRLGRDMSSEPVVEEGDEDTVPDSGTGIYYAIKIVDRNPKRKRLAGFNRNKGKTDGGKLINEIEIRKEIAIFKKVNHPNVVRMKEIIDDPDSSKLFMILEYCDGGELKWKDRSGHPYLSLDETRKIFRDTLLGLAYLHHQGIIHRDIKPSNLLFSGNGIVKISDFGCSHYSEALRTASALAGPEGEEYVDDIELAKTAGSPAFFAPEMCYTGFETDLSPRNSRSPQGTPVQELPAFTLRPPSLISEVGEMRGGFVDAVGMSPGGHTFPLVPTTSNDSGLSRRPQNQRTRSSVTVQRQPRHPITNAIDVWALGVTLYCLLFGKTPFDAPNEYLLMQVIPTANYEIPPTLGSDNLPTSNGSLEVQDCLDLLRRLLEKDPTKRITLEQAKKHPFTLEGIEDPSAWLARTDPHAQTFVTVSNDEVAAAVTKSSSFRDRFRKGIKSISHKLHIFGAGRIRSRSIGEGDSGHTSATSGKSSTATSQTNLAAQNKRVVSREASPLTSPSLGGSAPRRFSAFGARPEIPSPRRSSVQLAALPAPEMTSRSVSSQSAQKGLQKGFVVHRPQTHLPAPTLVTLSDLSAKRPIPRTAASTGSLDQLRSAETSPIRTTLHRRDSGASNTSSGFGHRLVKMLSGRSGSRTRIKSDLDDAPHAVHQPGSIEATSTIGSGGRPSIDSTSTDPRPSVWPQQANGYTRRGSTLSEDMFRPPVTEQAKADSKNDDDVDWDGELSDGDEYADPTLAPGVSVAPNLAPIPDISPIMIASPPRHSSPRGHDRLSHSSASPSSSWLHRDRTRSPLGEPRRYEPPKVEHDADEGLSYVSRRRKDSILSSASDPHHKK